MSKKEKFDMSDVSDIASEWRPSRGINWDKIQRVRFANADAEIPFEDSFTDSFIKSKNKESKKKDD